MLSFHITFIVTEFELLLASWSQNLVPSAKLEGTYFAQGISAGLSSLGSLCHSSGYYLHGEIMIASPVLSAERGFCLMDLPHTHLPLPVACL